MATWSAASTIRRNIALTGGDCARDLAYWAELFRAARPIGTKLHAEAAPERGDACKRYVASAICERMGTDGHDAGDVGARFVAAVLILAARYADIDTPTVLVPIPGDEPDLGSGRGWMFIAEKLAADSIAADLVDAVQVKLAGSVRHAAVSAATVAEELLGIDWRERAHATTSILCCHVDGNDPPPWRKPDGSGAPGPLDLVAALRSAEQDCSVAVDGDPARYPIALLEQIAADLVAIFTGLNRRIRQRIGELELPSVARRPAPAPQPLRPMLPIHLAFAAQAAVRPSQPCAVDARTSLTYAEVEARANRLASHLSACDAARSGFVALVAPTGVDRLVGSLGILKSGAGILPIDPLWPDSRIAFVLDAAEVAHIVVGDRDHGQRAAKGEHGRHVVNLAVSCRGDMPTAAPVLPIDLDRPLYCLFTSGSTGQPKGVVVSHRNYANRFAWLQARYGLGPRDNTVQRSPLTFDVGICELLRGGLAGATTCFMQPGEELDVRAIGAIVQRGRITSVDFAPSLVNVLLAAWDDALAAAYNSVRWFFVGAETLHPATVRSFNEVIAAQTGARMLNLWGATETTVDATVYDCADYPGKGRVPIGRPMRGAEIVVLDSTGHVCPPFMPGELCVAGTPVALGYIADRELTWQKFQPHDVVGGRILYRTGDVGRLLADGNFDLLGRIDNQIKHRGQTIEPAEIEAILERDPAIATVIVRQLAAPEERSTQLVAFVELRPDASPDEATWRLAVQNALPRAMHPDCYVVVPGFTYDVTGKIDHASLAVLAGPAAISSSRVPRTQLEREVLAVWELAFGRPVGVDDNFFALGGHSLTAAEMAFTIASTLSLRVDLAMIFANPTVASLAAALARETRSKLPAIAPLPPAAHYTLSQGQMRIWIALTFGDKAESYTVAGAYQLSGRLDVPALEASLNDLMTRHESLRTRFIVVDGTPFQVIDDPAQSAVQLAHTRIGTGPEADRTLRQKVAELKRVRFDLLRDQLLVLTLIERAADDHVLLVVTHHILVDEWSMRTLLGELLLLYAGRTGGPAAALEPLRVQYKDFAAWSTALLESGIFEPQRRYWRERLAAAPPPLRLPGAKVPAGWRRYQVDSYVCELQAGETRALAALAAELNITPFALYLGLFYLLLHRLTGETDIVVGSTFAGRRHIDLRNVVGFFINSLPLRIRFDPATTLPDFMRSVHDAAVKAADAELYPFERIVAENAPILSASGNAYFDIVFEFNNYRSDHDSGTGLSIRPLDENYDKLMFDLLAIVWVRNGRALVNFNYATELFDRDVIGKFAERLRGIVAQVLVDPSGAIADATGGQMAGEAALLDDLRRSRGITGHPAATSRSADLAAMEFRFEGSP